MTEIYRLKDLNSFIIVITLPVLQPANNKDVTRHALTIFIPINPFFLKMNSLMLNTYKLLYKLIIYSVCKLKCIVILKLHIKC